MDAYTLSGKMITLQEPAIKSGGEGAVYNIIGYNNVVAKIYLSKADAKERESKIREMSSLSETLGFRNTRILDDIAWPLAPLFNKAKEFIGFGMSRITAKFELDDIYSLSQKTNAGMNTDEKIKTLISLCTVVEKLHSCGQIFGDFNPNNIKIDNNCNVKFVDSDSYHFSAGKTVYPCVVCAPGYVAPELMKKCKGTTYSEYFAKGGVTFTKETDNFSLAIHCFRMLMNGCHPFNCKKHTRNVGSTPAPSIDKRVEKGETPFFTTVANFTTPDWAPDIKCLPMYLRRMFERAFVDGHANPSARPSATEWKQALVKYQKETTRCHVESKHYYWEQLKACPYCLASDRGKKNLIKTLGGTITPQMNVNRGNNNTNCNHAPTAQPVGRSASNNVFGNALNTYSSKTKPSNSVWFWGITVTAAIIMHILLGMYAYAPIYLSLVGEEWVMWIGSVGSVVSGVVGAVMYGLHWSGANRYPYDYKWYDYILSQLTGLGFAIGFGIALALVALIVIVVMYILVAVFVIALLIAFFSGLGSC